MGRRTLVAGAGKVKGKAKAEGGGATPGAKTKAPKPKAPKSEVPKPKAPKPKPPVGVKKKKKVVKRRARG